MSPGLELIRWELAQAFRAGGSGPMAVAFFAAVLTLVPLGIGPEPALLGRIAPGMVWVAAALASLLSLERLFQGDYEDGSLDALALSPLGLYGTALAKALAHWMAVALPILIAAPVFATLLHIEPQGIAPLMIGLLLGTPLFFLIGALGAALTLGLRRGGLLIALIVLPLYAPVVIFGVSAVEAAATGAPSAPSLMILGALLLAALVLAPPATAAALRLHLE